MRDGQLTLSENRVIGPRTTRAAFLAMFPNCRVLVENGQYCTYVVGHEVIRGRKFSVSAGFKGEALGSLSLRPVEGASWELDAIEKAKQADDRWLKDEYDLDPIYQASWGRLSSSIDPKNPTPYITITYGDVLP